MDKNINNIRQYLGIPYKHHGRTMEGMDCYGLISHIYRCELNIDLPDFDYNVEVDRDEVKSLPFLSLGWKETEMYDRFNIMVFRNIRLIGQVGMILSPLRFIHTSRRTGSIVSSISKERLRRLIGVYTWAG